LLALDQQGVLRLDEAAFNPGWIGGKESVEAAHRILLLLPFLNAPGARIWLTLSDL
jgi:hypothetical protein